MTLTCKYFENDKVDVQFTFDCYPDRIFKPKQFRNHSHQYQYDEVLEWANQYAGTAIFFTAYIDSLWKGMPDSQRNTLFPKMHLMWTSLDNSTNDSIPEWIDTAAGYMPLIKRINATDCLFFGTENDILKYFTEVTEELIPDVDDGNSQHIIHHVYCPHCGKKIF